MATSNKTRRIIVNDDGWIMSEAGPPLTVDDLREKMVATYAGTPVDALFWNIGGNEVYSHETEVGERYGEGYESAEELKNDTRARNIRHLIDTCGGPLTVLTTLCHEAGMDLFASVRMNSHYDADLLSPVSGRFRREHPGCLIGLPGETFAEGSLEWGVRTGINFAVPGVRSHMAAIIIELFERFDTNGVELDFMRHPAFFRIDEAYANRYLMTDMIRQVRQRMNEVCAARGKTLNLAVRVPPTIADSARIGLDVEQWIADDLVDIVIGGGGFIPFETPLEEFVEAARGTECQIYGCLEHLRTAIDDEVVRAIASRYWSAGASGLYLFNYFSKPIEWKQRVLNEIGDKDTLSRLNKRYHMDHSDRLAPRDLHDYAFRYAVPAVQLPVRLMPTPSGHGLILRVRIEDDVEAACADEALMSCVLRMSFEKFCPEDELEVLLNGDLLSPNTDRSFFGDWTRHEWTQYPQGLADVTYSGGRLEFDLHCPPLQQGTNEIEMHLIKRTDQQDEALALRDVEVVIEYKQMRDEG